MEEKIELTECNVYNKCRKIYNAVVEIWENTATGECSVGWYKTDDTYEEVDVTGEWG